MVEFFEVDESRGDGARWQGGCGKADAFRERDAVLLSGGEPAVKLGEGRAGEVGTIENAFGVLVGAGSARGFAGRGDWRR